MLQIEIGPNALSAMLALLALIGTIVTGVISYLNGRRIREVQRNTNGMTEQLVAAAFKDGRDLGRSEAHNERRDSVRGGL